jgi:hypothetical protein
MNTEPNEGSRTFSSDDNPKPQEVTPEEIPDLVQEAADNGSNWFVQINSDN